MAYSAPVNSASPAFVCIQRDGSESMEDGVLVQGRKTTKAQGCAETANRFFCEVVQNCHDNGRVRNAFEFCGCTYGNGTLGPLFGGALERERFITVSQLIGNPLRLERAAPISGEDHAEVDLPVWVEARAEGDTPMRRAFEETVQLVSEWIATHPAAFPPVVINITDGESTDGSPAEAARALTSLQTLDGNVLLFNVQLSAAGKSPVIFPARPDDLPDRFSRLLFDISSILPDPMAQAARRLGVDVEPGARALICNAGLRDIMTALLTGTQLAPRR